MRTINRMPLTTLWTDVGDTLVWKDLKDCYTFYKTEVKDKISEDDYWINIDDGLVYVASDWGMHAGFQVVVLEAHH